METKTARLDDSYKRHIQHSRYIEGLGKFPPYFTQPGTINAWRHIRMMSMLDGVLEAFPGASWLTIGDGRFGADANYLNQHGADATATNIDGGQLEIAKAQGFIDKYAVENAEALSVADDSFDFAFCKESYHHFPRPPLAFYEMLRVARRAVVLIEPQESGRCHPLAAVKRLLKRRLKGRPSDEFEKGCKNFVFRLRVRQVEKMLCSLGYETVVAYRCFNDAEIARYALAPIDRLCQGAIITRLVLRAQDLGAMLGLMDYGLATVIAFLEPPSPELEKRLRRDGFRIRHLPRNPYVEAAAKSAAAAIDRQHSPE